MARRCSLAIAAGFPHTAFLIAPGCATWQALTRKIDPAELVNLSTFDSTMGMPMPLDVQVCADGTHAWV